MRRGVAPTALALLAVAAAGALLWPDGPGTKSADEGPPPAPASPPSRFSREQHAAAARLGVPVEFENDQGMRFVLVPAGSFLMGSPQDEPFRDGDESRHEADVPQAFYLQATEVTNEQYRRFDAAHTSLQGRRREPAEVDAGDRPALTTHDGAERFAAWASAGDRERAYRLPTETEWEHACRAGAQTAYWWGDERGDAIRFENLLGAEDGFETVAPGARFPANPWGLHDMLGNVCELCADDYGPYPDAPDAAVARCEEVLLWRRGERVVRGACWRDDPVFARCAYRDTWGETGSPWHHRARAQVGFRLAASLARPEPERRRVAWRAREAVDASLGPHAVKALHDAEFVDWSLRLPQARLGRVDHGTGHGGADTGWRRFVINEFAERLVHFKHCQFDFRRARTDAAPAMRDVLLRVLPDANEGRDHRDGSGASRIPVLLHLGRAVPWGDVEVVLDVLLTLPVPLERVQYAVQPVRRGEDRRVDLRVRAAAPGPAPAGPALRLFRASGATRLAVAEDTFAFPVGDAFDDERFLRPANETWSAVARALGDAAPGRAVVLRTDGAGGVAWAYVVKLLDLLVERGVRTVALPDAGKRIEILDPGGLR